MRLSRIALVALVCVVLYPSLASAQDEAFKKGMQARNDKNWAEVERQMRSALQSDSVDSPRKVKSNVVLSVFGAQGSEYLPHFFLGEALWNQKQCGPAVEHWLISEQQKAVLGSKPEYRQTMQKGYQECAAKGVLLRAEFDAQMAASRQVYDGALAIAKRVNDLKDSHKDLWQPFAPQFETARKDLENAYNRLGAAQRTRMAADFAEVKTASERATGTLKSLEDTFHNAIDGVASLQQRIHDVTDDIAAAGEIDKAIDNIKATLTDPLAASRKSGRDQLGQARDKLAAGQKTSNLVAVNEAGKLVQGAAGTLNQVLDELKKAQRGERDRQVSVATRAADEAFASVSAAMTTLDGRAAQKPENFTPDISSQRDALKKQIETLRQRYERARRSDDVAGIESVTKQTLESQTVLNKIIQAFGPLSLRDRGVSASLEDGARLFLAGDYQRVLTALDPSTGVDAAASPSLQLQAHLFRAASLFALYVRSGENRQELRTQTLAEIDLCKQIDATFQPSTQVFAPRFITLYKTGGAAAQTAAVTQ